MRLEPAARASEPLTVFRNFLARHRGQPDFEAECRLLGPIIEEDAGIIYVVDGSEPLLEIHIAEMEILRLTGQPRLAIINRTKAEDHLAEWRRRLGLHFNAVREFNAHYASFSDRVELLETLAGIEQRWKPQLMAAVAIFREEWEKRLDDCAEIIFDLAQRRAHPLRDRSRIRVGLAAKSRRRKAQGAIHACRQPARSTGAQGS